VETHKSIINRFDKLGYLMTEDELRDLSKEVAEIHVMTDDKQMTTTIIARLAFHVGRLVSHIQSEQRGASEMKQLVTLHDQTLFGDRKQDLGLSAKYDEVKRFMETNRKFHWIVTSGVLALVLKEVWSLITHH